LNSWQHITSPEYKLRKVKRLLRTGPVCLQETKWNGTQQEAVYQNIPGVRVNSSEATVNTNGELTGGVAILFPAGWIVQKEIELVKGRAIATLVKDGPSAFISSPFIFDRVSASRTLSKSCKHGEMLKSKAQSSHVFIAGDFNNVDQFFLIFGAGF